MKGNLLLIFLILVIIFCYVMAATVPEHTYWVEVHFCDNRPSIKRKMVSTSPPNSRVINLVQGYPQAWVGNELFINVCDIKTIKQI